MISATLKRTGKWVLVTTCLLVSGCQTVPVDDIELGAKPIPSSDLAGLLLASERYEKSLLNAPNLIKDDAINSYISELVCELAGEHCPNIRVYLHEVPYFNAFMLPNGAMVVWSGLLLRASTEDELAFVLAHEIGHYVKQHSLKQYRRSKGLSNMLSIVNIAAPYVGLFSQLASLGVLSKYSRTHETESDAFAVTTLKSTNRNAQGGAALFELLLSEEESLKKNKKKSLFLATHPTTKNRIAAISAAAHSENLITPTANSYKSVIRQFYPKWLENELRKRSFLSTETLLKILLSKEQVPDEELDFAFGNLYRKRGYDGDLQLAINHYENYVRGNENPNSSAFRHIAEIQEKLNEPLKAIESYEIYLMAEPNAYDADLVKSKLNLLRNQ